MPGAIENAAAAAANGVASADGPVVYEPFVVIEQHVNLELEFRAKRVKGSTTIKVFKMEDGLEYVTLDARQCEIDKEGVRVNGRKVKVEYRDPYELLATPDGYTWGARQHHLRRARMKPLEPIKRAELPMTGREDKGCQPAVGSLRVWLRPEKIRLKPQTPGASGPPPNPVDLNTFEITIPFEVRNPRDGLQFVGVEDGDDRYPHAFTRHSLESGYVSSLFPCVDDRTRVLQWKICLTFPATVGSALEQPLASHAHPVVPPNAHQRGSYVLTEEDKLLDMTAVCSGTLVGVHEDKVEKTTRRMEFEARFCGAQHIGFAIGPFEDVDLYSAYRSEEDEAKLAGTAVKVHGYCLPHRRDEVENTCQPLANATDFFTLTFSKYPFSENSYKLCFVDDMTEDTTPLQGFSLASSRLLYPEDVIDNEVEVTRKLVHTIASQYFGVFINPNERTDTWIVIGLAYYMTDLYLRKLAGNNYYRYQMRMSATKLTEVDHGRPSLHDLGRILHLGDFEMDFMALKAPLVIFILDRRLMKSSNSSGVTRVISQRLREATQNAGELRAANFVLSSDNFRRQCEKKGRLRLEDFWDQWVLGSGCPRFHVTQRFNKKRLEVEVTVIQNQNSWAQEPHQLEKHDFWRDIVEELHNVEASEVPLTFTGPMTFRVHEADGTPYEHCLEIKLDAAATKGSRLSMPYNTKYKRIKRTRQTKRAKELAKAQRDPDRMDEDGHEDDDQGHNLSMFGDVLIGEEDMSNWKLVDWDGDMQNQMDQESYEWIRVDCDFEWIFDLQTNFKVYMTVAQLQQDRDIAGQVEAMLTLTRNAPSNIQTTMLLRTLYDNRYYYGIRTMAANALTGHADPANKFRGMHHLIRVFKKSFCYPDTTTPRPNNFSNKKEYYVQKVIPMALAKIRGGNAFCPREARQLILDQLIFNNNEENPYSDQIYIAKLLEALATSLVRVSTNTPGQAAPDPELRDFVDQAMEQIQRYENMDEWIGTHDNIWVVAALDAKLKLMKSGLINLDAKCFAQYTLPQNNHTVQLKAFEALIELGYLLRPSVMKLIITELSTNRSPYVRDQLFKLLTRGLAAIAFGEMDVQRDSDAKPLPADGGSEGDKDVLMMDEDDDGGLIVEQSDDVIKRRQDKIARQKDITTAIKALKDVLQEDEDLQRELWKALDSQTIGLVEKRNLLELCATLFPEEDEMMVTMKYPARWKVARGDCVRNRVSSRDSCHFGTHSNMAQSLILNFTRVHKTEPKKRKHEQAFPADAGVPAVAPAPAPALVPSAAPANVAPPVPPSEERKPEKPKSKVIKLSRGSIFSSKSTAASSAPSPAPASRQPSIAVASPPAPAPTPPAKLERGDSIAVQGRAVAGLAPAAPPATAEPATEPARQNVSVKAAKTSKKRKLAETDAPAAGPLRLARKIVTIKYRKEKLTEAQRQVLGRVPSSAGSTAPADSIIAAPAARARVQATSPLPRGPSPADASKASFTSTLSAGSTSQPSASQHTQRTPLSNGKVRKPLPGGAGPTPAKASPIPRSKPGPSGSASPMAARSSTEPGAPKRKIVKLKLQTKKLKDLASSTASTSSSRSSSRPQSQTQLGSPSGSSFN